MESKNQKKGDGLGISIDQHTCRNLSDNTKSLHNFDKYILKQINIYAKNYALKPTEIYSKILKSTTNLYPKMPYNFPKKRKMKESIQNARGHVTCLDLSSIQNEENSKIKEAQFFDAIGKESSIKKSIKSYYGWLKKHCVYCRKKTMF